MRKSVVLSAMLLALAACDTPAPPTLSLSPDGRPQYAFRAHSAPFAVSAGLTDEEAIRRHNVKHGLCPDGYDILTKRRVPNPSIVIVDAQIRCHSN